VKHGRRNSYERRRAPELHALCPMNRRDALRNLGLLTGALISPPGMLAKGNGPNGKFNIGACTKIYDPSNGRKDRWYINDHTFIRSEDGQWHLFGITHREPANAQDEKFLAHAIAPNLCGPKEEEDLCFARR
jgi:arabinan endo-1,5-alpha-L-arabinosidase